MKRNYVFLLLIASLFSPFMMQAQRQVFFTESMGEAAPSPAPIVTEWTGWHNPNLTFSSGGIDSIADIRATYVSAAAVPPYPEGSGSNNAYFAADTLGNVARGFAMNGIDASAFKNIQLTFGYRKSLVEVRSDFEVYYSIGSEWVKLDFQFVEETEPTGWYRVPAINLPQEAEVNGLGLRFVRPTNSTNSIRLDDVWLTGEPKIAAAPVIKEATDVNSTGFKVAWDAYPNATSYLLDVSKNGNFTAATEPTELVAWTFPVVYVRGEEATANIFTSNNQNMYLSTSATGNGDDKEPIPYPGGSGTESSPYAFVSTGWEDGVYTKHFIIDVNTTGFYGLTLSSEQYSSGNGPQNMKVQYRLEGNHEWIDVPNSDVVMPAAAYGPTSKLTDLPLPTACDNQEVVSIRWTMTGSLRTSGKAAYIVTSGGTSRIANIFVKGMEGDFVPGYQSVAVSGTSHTVTGLEANKTYFYRVRATDGTYVSNASDVKQAATGGTSLKSILNQQSVQVHYNSLTDCFDVKALASITNVSVKVSDMSGRTLSQTNLSGSERSIKANNLPAGVYIITLSVDGQSFNQKCFK